MYEHYWDCRSPRYTPMSETMAEKLAAHAKVHALLDKAKETKK